MSYRYVLDSKLCVSCGICAAICPKQCIKMNYEEGQELPVIDGEKCINCKKCEIVCGQHEKLMKEDSFPVAEKDLECYSAWIQESEQLKKSTSGGIVTALIETLLFDNSYEIAYLVSDVTSKERLSAKGYRKGEELDPTRKSKYVPVSYRIAVQEILKEPNRHVILVATPCVIKNLINVMEMFHLKRENFLLIGLFCDKTLNYNIIPYFEHFSAKKMSHLYFREKGKSGWPGDVKICFEDGSYKYLPRLVRAFAKDYFQLESCLYCFDKLNSLADISVGDDYTSRKTKEGKNSVIVRTEKGKQVFQKLKINKELCSFREIENSQGISKKAENKLFRKYLYDANSVGKEICDNLVKRKAKIEMGRKYLSNNKVRCGIHFIVTKKRIIEKMRIIKKWILQAGKKE